VVSNATILSGTYPQAHHASELGAQLPPSLPYLPDLLHARGYRTAAVIGSSVLDAGNGFVSGFDRGFEAYEAGSGTGEATSAQLVARAVEWLNRNPQGPFFLWIQIGPPRALNVSTYNRYITSADAALGQFLATLRKQRAFDDCLVVVTSDHGDSLGAHGEETHGNFLYDETIHVPLLLKLPQSQGAERRVKGTVRLVDIAPTILEVARLPVPPAMQGQSLLRIAKSNTDAGQPVYSRSDFPQEAFGWSALEAWRSGKYLYIRAPKPELYDLSSDPGATHNLAQSSKAVLDTMATQLTAFDSHFEKSATQNETGLTSAEMQKLASLGYVGLQRNAPAGAAGPAGTDPKDVIADANKTLNAMRALDQARPESAIAPLRQVLNTEPNSYLVHYGLGAALARKQQYKEAIEHLHRAIELRPDSAKAQFEMGSALMKTSDFKAAAVHLEIASTHLRSFAPAHAALAEAYDHLGRKEDASHERAKSKQ
jgi:choline-sulfatase